jgi:hypothetical protein
MDWQVVHVRVNDAATGKPTPVRIRFATPEGQYLAPLGRLAEFPTGWGEQVGGSVMLGDRRYAYIDGTCEIRLPTGPIHVEISKGLEYIPIQQTIERKAGQIALRFAITRKFNLQAEGWYAGDTRVHFLSPRAAWLEGAAEGLQVVNLLAAEWRFEDGSTWLTNLLDFSGQEPAYAKDGCVVVANTVNDGGKLGALALLNCHRIVHPLRLDQEGFEKYTLLDWCNQCHRKGGLVIWPGYGGGGAEAEAALRLGHIDAIEWAPTSGEFPLPFIFQWHKELFFGFRVPLVGGSGKEGNDVDVGAIRTYAQLQSGQEFSYRHWIEAIRHGRTFATWGPLLRFTVNGHGPGATILLEDQHGPVTICAEANSVVPFDKLVVVHDGQTLAEADPGPDGSAALTVTSEIQTAGWLAAQCYADDVLVAHTSPIYLRGRPRPITRYLLWTPETMLEYDWTPWLEEHVPNAQRRERVQAILADARKVLEQRLKQA